MPPLLVLMDVILVVALIPEGLVLWKDDMGAPLILPNGLPYSSILVSLTLRRKRKDQNIVTFEDTITREMATLYLRLDAGEFVSVEEYFHRPRNH